MKEFRDAAENGRQSDGDFWALHMSIMGPYGRYITVPEGKEIWATSVNEETGAITHPNHKFSAGIVKLRVAKAKVPIEEPDHIMLTGSATAMIVERNVIDVAPLKYFRLSEIKETDRTLLGRPAILLVGEELVTEDRVSGEYTYQQPVLDEEGRAKKTGKTIEIFTTSRDGSEDTMKPGFIYVSTILPVAPEEQEGQTQWADYGLTSYHGGTVPALRLQVTGCERIPPIGLGRDSMVIVGEDMDGYFKGPVKLRLFPHEVESLLGGVLPKPGQTFLIKDANPDSMSRISDFSRPASIKLQRSTPVRAPVSRAVPG